MQGIMETLFDVWYLITVITIGFIMFNNANKNKQYKLFGFMAILLGFGDAFHLIPRAYSLLTTGLESNAVALGFGKLVTSITMTIFYVILYHIWRKRYGIKEKKFLTILIYCLAIARIILCLFPQNDWFSYNSSFIWGIYRNVPFLILGIIIIILFAMKIRESKDKDFKFMPLAIGLSFFFYIGVVLFADKYPIIGMLMLPKTLAYVWIVVMGYKVISK